jgi:hypothetical protein
MLAHFQDEAHKLHEQVQAQEREVRTSSNFSSRTPVLMKFQALELQTLLDEQERHDQLAGLGSTSGAPSCAPISGPFTTVPIQPQSHFKPQLSASQLQGYEY